MGAKRQRIQLHLRLSSRTLLHPRASARTLRHPRAGTESKHEMSASRSGSRRSKSASADSDLKLDPTQDAKIMPASRSGSRRSMSSTVAADFDLRWVPTRCSQDAKIVCFRIRSDEALDGSSSNGRGEIYSRFYFINSKHLLSPPVVEPPLYYHYLMSKKPPHRSHAVPVYCPRYHSPDLPSNLSSEFATSAFVDGQLYVIGGFAYEGSLIKDVCGLDMRVWSRRIRCDLDLPLEFSLGGWKRRRSMKFAKLNPQSVVVDGKIYVFGIGPNADCDTPFVEVYSPKTNKWDSQKCDRPPYDGVKPILGVSCNTINSKHILLQPSFNTDLYTYSIASNTLSLHPKFRPFHEVSGRAVVVDGILYSYQGDEDEEVEEDIVGYDLSGDQCWAPIPILGLDPFLIFPMSEMQLVSIAADMLCVIWTDQSIDKDDKMKVFVTTFKMFKLKRFPNTYRSDEPSILLQASHVSSRCYLLPGSGTLLDCLVI